MDNIFLMCVSYVILLEAETFETSKQPFQELDIYVNKIFSIQLVKTFP